MKLWRCFLLGILYFPEGRDIAGDSPSILIEQEFLGQCYLLTICQGQVGIYHVQNL